MRDDEAIDFENHEISAGSYYYVNCPTLLEHYGLGKNGSVGYVCFESNDNISFPETINTLEQLKEYFYTEDFIESLDNMGLVQYNTFFK